MIVLTNDNTNAHIVMSVGQIKVLALALAQLEIPQMKDVALLMMAQGYKMNEGTVAGLITEFHFNCRKVLETDETEEEEPGVADLPSIKEDKPN